MSLGLVAYASSDDSENEDDDVEQITSSTPWINENTTNKETSVEPHISDEEDVDFVNNSSLLDDEDIPGLRFEILLISKRLASYRKKCAYFDITGPEISCYNFTL